MAAYQEYGKPRPTALLPHQSENQWAMPTSAPMTARVVAARRPETVQARATNGANWMNVTASTSGEPRGVQPM